MEIIRSLENSKIISDFTIQDFKTFPNGFYIHIIAKLINRTIFFAREYSDEIERNYSYHWQSENNDLIMRWDNSPHYKEISTFPHHRHNSSMIEPSNEISVEDVLRYIQLRI
jgi:hypothetical protein